MVHRKENAATIEWFGKNYYVIITCNDCGYATDCTTYPYAFEAYKHHYHQNGARM